MVEGLIFERWSSAVNKDIIDGKKSESLYSTDLIDATEMLQKELGKVTVFNGLNKKNTKENDKEIQDLLAKISLM